MNAEIFQLDGKTYQDPDSHQVTFVDPNGVVQGTIVNPTRDALGKYSCYLTLTSPFVAGNWHTDWKITIGSVPDIARVWYYVVA